MSRPAPLPPHGVIIYEGPSMIDGAPIVVVLTSIRGTSNNTKTSAGLPLAQTYVIPRAMLQGMAAGDKSGNSRAWFAGLAEGRDASACGACDLRPAAVAAARAAGLPAPDPCYVLNGPPDVAAALVAGTYPTATLEDAAAYVRAMVRRGRIAGVRGGSWGDPAAAPLAVHAALRAALVDEGGSWLRVRHPDGVERRAAWTCYTRTWEYAPAAAAGWRRLAMASAHTPLEARRALVDGWRPFLAVDGRRPEAVAAAVALVTDEPGMHCPASNERGHVATCATCSACDGARPRATAASGAATAASDAADPRGAVVILSHGPSNRGAKACAANVAILARLDAARRARAEARRASAQINA